MLTKRSSPDTLDSKNNAVQDLLKISSRQHFYKLLNNENQSEIVDYWNSKLHFLFGSYFNDLLVTYEDLKALLKIDGELPDLPTILVRIFSMKSRFSRGLLLL